MPRYFFHLEDGHTIIDHEGIELLNLRVARDQAVRSSGEILHDRTRSFPLSAKPWRLWVTDGPGEAGKTLFTLLHNLILPTYGYACYETQAAGSRRPSSQSRGRKLWSRFWEPMASSARGVSPDICIDMSEQDNIDRVWDIIEKVGVCMLTTQFAGGLRARPIEARPDRDAGLIFFVTDVHSAKEDEIEAAPDVGLVFIDPKDKAYLSITGRARVMRDAAKTKVFWRKTDEFWWPGGPTDSDVCLLRIEPLTAELWDGPASAAVAAFEFAKAKLTGEEPKLGENRKVTVEM